MFKLIISFLSWSYSCFRENAKNNIKFIFHSFHIIRKTLPESFSLFFQVWQQPNFSQNIEILEYLYKNWDKVGILITGVTHTFPLPPLKCLGPCLPPPKHIWGSISLLPNRCVAQSPSSQTHFCSPISLLPKTFGAQSPSSQTSLKGHNLPPLKQVVTQFPSSQTGLWPISLLPNKFGAQSPPSKTDLGPNLTPPKWICGTISLLPKWVSPPPATYNQLMLQNNL